MINQRKGFPVHLFNRRRVILLLLLTIGVCFLSLPQANAIEPIAYVEHPFFEGGMGVEISGDYLYAHQRGGNGIWIFNISNPHSPTIDSVYWHDYLSNSQDLALKENYIYVVASDAGIDGDTSGAITVLNIDGSDISYVSWYYNSSLTTEPLRIHINGDYAYITDISEDMFYILNISDPTNLQLVNYYINSTVIDGPVGIYSTGDYTYILGQLSNTFAVFDTSNKSDIQLITYIQNNTYLNHARDIAVEGDYAYITTNSAYYSLTIIDISNPNNPSIIGYLNDNINMSKTSDVQIDGDYAYVTSHEDNTFNIINISDKSNPTLIDTCHNDTILLNAHGITVNGEYIYTVSRNHLVVFCIPFVNITAKDEVTGDDIKPITVEYPCGSKICQKSGDYVTLDVLEVGATHFDITVSASGYESRSYSINLDASQNMTVYLLTSAEASDITFHVLAWNSDVVGANITVTKNINGEYGLIAQKITDSLGRTSIPLKFFDTYRVTVSTTEYGTKQLDIEINEYTITIQMTEELSLVDYLPTHSVKLIFININTSERMSNIPVIVTDIYANVTDSYTTDDYGILNIKVDDRHKYRLDINNSQKVVEMYMKDAIYIITVGEAGIREINQTYQQYEDKGGDWEWNLTSIASYFKDSVDPVAKGIISSVVLAFAMIPVSLRFGSQGAVAVGMIILVILYMINLATPFMTALTIMTVIGLYVLRERW